MSRVIPDDTPKPITSILCPAGLQVGVRDSGTILGNYGVNSADAMGTIAQHRDRWGFSTGWMEKGIRGRPYHEQIRMRKMFGSSGEILIGMEIAKQFHVLGAGWPRQLRRVSK